MVGLRSRCESTERLAVDDDARGGASASLMAATSYSDRGEMYGCVFRSRSQIHPINTNTSTSIQLLGSLASEVEMGCTSSWKQKSGHRRVFLLPILITGSKQTDIREISRPGLGHIHRAWGFNNLVDHILQLLASHCPVAQLSSPDLSLSASDAIEEYMIAISRSPCR